MVVAAAFVSIRRNLVWEPPNNPRVLTPGVHLHDVDMEPVGTSFHRPRAFCAQVGEISRENRRRNNRLGSHCCGAGVKLFYVWESQRATMPGFEAAQKLRRSRVPRGLAIQAMGEVWRGRGSMTPGAGPPARGGRGGGGGARRPAGAGAPLRLRGVFSRHRFGETRGLGLQRGLETSITVPGLRSNPVCWTSRLSDMEASVVLEGVGRHSISNTKCVSTSIIYAGIY